MHPSDPSTILVALAIIGATHWVGAVTAYGSTLMAFSGLIWFLGVTDTRTVLLFTGAVQAYQVFFFTYRDVDWPHLRHMVVLAGLGLPVGVLAVHKLPEAPLITFLGLVMVCSGLSRLRSPAHPRPWPRPALNGLVLLGGVIHGAFVSGGSTLVVYAQHLVPEKHAFRGTLSFFFVVINTVLIGSLFVRGGEVTRVSAILLAALPMTLLLNWSANRVARRLSQQHFVRAVAGLLIVAGCILIGRVLLR